VPGKSPAASAEPTKSPSAFSDVDAGILDAVGDANASHNGDTDDVDGDGSAWRVSSLPADEAAAAAAAAFGRAVMLLLGSRAALTFGIAAVTGRKLSSAWRSFFSVDTVQQAGFMGGFASA
jgi:hypothetical protein